MLCSAKELNIGQDHDGIMVVDASIALGTDLNTLYTDTDIIDTQMHVLKYYKSASCSY